MEKIKGILVSMVALIALVSFGWASPNGSQIYREVVGKVQTFNPQAGFVVVNGQKLTLAKNVRYEYGRPGVGSYVEVELINQQGKWLVYKLEVKQRLQGEGYDDGD